MNWIMSVVGAVAVVAAVASPSRAGGVHTVGGTACVTTSVGLDSTHANFAALAFSGRAVAQVFMARDTLISAVTVWRNAANYANVAGMHLFICKVDSSLRPLPATGVLLDGPTMHPTVSDSVFAPLRYELNPPFALPSPGHYAIAIKEEDPTCSYSFTVLGDTTDSYPDGDGWIIHPFADCHALGSNAITLGVEQPAELIFAVEFCEMSTPAVSETWGRLKARYR